MQQYPILILIELHETLIETGNVIEPSDFIQALFRKEKKIIALFILYHILIQKDDLYFEYEVNFAHLVSYICKNIKMKTIIIPTDFSKNARTAVLYALSMFDIERSRFILVNAYSMPSTGRSGMITNLSDDLSAESKSGLQKEKNELIALIGEKADKIETFSKMGDLSSVVEGIKEKVKASYIIIGTKGASGIEGILIGSNAYDIVSNVACPVFIVPEKASFSGIKKIVFAADFQRINDEIALNPLVELVNKNNASLDIINVVSSEKSKELSDQKSESSLKIYFEQMDKCNFHTVQASSVEEGINNYVESNGADLVVMLSRKNGFFDTIFQRSITKKIVLDTSIPVLALHDK